MDFNSIEFLAFLIITLALYYAFKLPLRWIVLLFASFFFIYSFSIKFLIYTICFALLNYLFGIAIAKKKDTSNINLIYYIGIWINIGLLVFYKYANFLLENLFSLIRISIKEIDTPTLKLLVPLGISFYTFQAIGYLIDLKRGTKSAETNPGKFILFIVFFPKFISGPIERSNTLLPQINKLQKFNEPLFNEGLLQVLWGFIKTVIISDRLSIIVNGVYGNLYEISGWPLLINFFIQFLYLYFNFSGYTDIVIGISKLFGINLTGNFNRPLFSVNVSNYWRRWHISLTSWCNDYIFRRIILKRVKWGIWAAVYAVFITFSLIGIWHGANWNFLILGLLQGAAINYEYFTKGYRLRLGSKVPLWLNLSVSRFLTLLFICFSHVFFFSKDLKDTVYYFANMFKNEHISIINAYPTFKVNDLVIVSVGVLLILFSEYRDEKGLKSIKNIILQNKTLLWIVIICTLTILIALNTASGSGFIYTQF